MASSLSLHVRTQQHRAANCCSGQLNAQSRRLESIDAGEDTKALEDPVVAVLAFKETHPGLVRLHATAHFVQLAVTTPAVHRKLVRTGHSAEMKEASWRGFRRP